MQKKKKQYIFNFFAMLLISALSGILLLILSINIVQNSHNKTLQDVVKQGAVVVTQKHTVFSDSFDTIAFLTLLAAVILFGFGTISIYNHNLRKKIIYSNKRLTILYSELKDSEEELKSQLARLELNEKLIKRSEERYSFVINALKIGIWDYDATTGYTYLAPQLYKMFGFESEDFLNYAENWPYMVHPKDRLETFRIFKTNYRNKAENFEGSFRHVTRFGQYRWVHAIAKAKWDTDGKLLRLAGSITDITDKKENEEKIKHMAYYDSLTGLPNREYLEEYVNEIIQRGKMVALVFIDIDNFKYINDSLGHSIGDSVIVEMGKRISNLVSNGFVSRWGGDELIVVIEKVESTEEICEFAQNLVEKVYLNFCTNGITLNSSVSAGVAIFPEHGKDFESLLRNADTAMYAAKYSGKNQYSIFNFKMNEVLYNKMKYEGMLRDALENNELQLYFQPQYDMQKQTLHGVEALLRWNNEHLGNVSPTHFIPVAEASGLIIPLGKWVFRKSCEFLLKLTNLGFDNIIVAINISALQIKQEDFVRYVKSYINGKGINPKMLEFEITESILVDSTDSTIMKLKELRELGIKIALDDFGTGYSSLTYLRQLPIDTLKIDKSFIDNVAVNNVDQDISGLIVNIAHSLGLKVVAEGVEKPEQRDLLLKYGCDIAQGYLYSKPLEEEVFLEKLS